MAVHGTWALWEFEVSQLLNKVSFKGVSIIKLDSMIEKCVLIFIFVVYVCNFVFLFLGNENFRQWWLPGLVMG